ncbi:hypothetical protein VCHENC02_2984A, partial [Vibrio harveyi]
MSTRLK